MTIFINHLIDDDDDDDDDGKQWQDLKIDTCTIEFC
jgi:hypothetical protein